MVNPTLKEEVIQLEADFCAALSDPTRIFILYALNECSQNVTELTNERQGTVITYHLVDGRVIQALDLLRSAMRDRLNQRASLVNQVG
jgi:hypothetical protein